MSSFAIPPVLLERMVRLGDRIRTARIRRGWSVSVLAAKAAINRNTLTALEHGKPSTSVASLLAVLWALGLDEAIELLADPDRDLHGKALEASQRAHRVCGGRASDTNSYDF